MAIAPAKLRLRYAKATFKLSSRSGFATACFAQWSCHETALAILGKTSLGLAEHGLARHS